MSSEPRWLADKGAFVFWIDANHPAVLGPHDQVTVIPMRQDPAAQGVGWFVQNNNIFSGTRDQHFVWSFEAATWPTFRTTANFRLSGGVVDCQGADGSEIFCSWKGKTIVRVDFSRRHAAGIGAVTRQWVTYLAPSKDGIGFVSLTWSSDIWKVLPDGTRVRQTWEGNVLTASRCTADVFLANTSTAEGGRIVRLRAGQPSEIVTDGDVDSSPVCTKKGLEWWYNRASADRGGFYRCNSDGCQRFLDGLVFAAVASPDETRIAFATRTSGLAPVSWIPAGGGQQHDVAFTETGCAPGWSSDRTLWISRRYGGQLVWTEVNADTAKETGRTVPGGKDCIDNEADPSSPVDPDFRVVTERTSQVRWQALH